MVMMDPNVVAASAGSMLSSQPVSGNASVVTAADAVTVRIDVRHVMYSI